MPSNLACCDCTSLAAPGDNTGFDLRTPARRFTTLACGASPRFRLPRLTKPWTAVRKNGTLLRGDAL
jgi:hypothetical protein